MKTTRLHLPVLLLAALAAACGRAGRERAAAANSADSARRQAAADSGDRACPARAGQVALKVSANGPEFRFRVFGNAAGEVDSIAVSRGCARVQTLRPEDNILPPGYGTPRLAVQDLDFDGYGDLKFLAVAGAGGNVAYEYWRYDPASGRFQPLGGYDEFDVDSAHRVLTNRNQCCGGMQWTLSTYRVENGKVVTLRREEMAQGEALVRSRRYVHTVRERSGDSLALVRTDTVSQAEAKRPMFDGS